MKIVSRIKIATVVCWGVAAVALSGLAIWAATGSLFGIQTGFRLFGLSIGGIENLIGEYKLQGTYTVPADAINALAVDWVAGKVEITPYDGTEITLSEYAQRELSENERLHLSVSGGTVTVRFIEASRIQRMPPKRLEAQIPRRLCENLVRLGIDATSADISVTGIKTEKLTAESTSGDISLSALSAAELYGRSTSGDVSVTDCVCGGVDIGGTSGNMSVSGVIADSLSTGTTSGGQKLSGAFTQSVYLDGVSGGISIENSAVGASLRIGTTSGAQKVKGAFDELVLGSVSGGVHVTNSVMPSRLDVDTTSGGVALTLPDSEIAVNHDTVSGSFKSDIPVTLRSGGGAFNLSTVSGSVRIYKLA